MVQYSLCLVTHATAVRGTVIPQKQICTHHTTSLLPHNYLTTSDSFDKSVRIRVENLHYDLTEDDLRVSQPPLPTAS